MGPAFEAETQSWIRIIKARAGPGMWLVTRGYHQGDDLVAVITNAPFSHASIIDPEKGTVIEAIAKGVIETPLQKFLSETHRVVIVKPKGWTEEGGKVALQKSRKQLGKGYDFLGTIGAPSKKRWYCSELAVWSNGQEVNKKGPKNIYHPRALIKMGTVLFDSNNRDGAPESLPN
jgi:hypothetical protein